MEAFFHFDPLLAVTAFIASRALLAFFGFAAVTVVVTLIFGRVFCGWVCPLGAVHQFSSFVFKKTKFLRPPREEKSRASPRNTTYLS